MEPPPPLYRKTPHITLKTPCEKNFIPYYQGMDKVDSSTVRGRVGECLVIYLLEKMGVECHHVDRSGVDLWCQSRNGDVFTVQVKSANRNPRLSRYSYNLRTTKTADFYVFVALDTERLFVQSIDEVTTAGAKQFAASKFTKEEMKQGLERLSNFTSRTQ